jgi:EAL domain-containing protein (putative c-di-GMP-specific phosphodiesterase class I)
VLELTEHTPLSGSEELLRRLQYLRDNGERFALDDAGAGFSGIASLALLTPEFVKVDIALVRGCDRDPVKQAIISALVHYVKRANGVLVAEGVETVGERATVQDLGVDCIQGFLVGKPMEDPNGPSAG